MQTGGPRRERTIRTHVVDAPTATENRTVAFAHTDLELRLIDVMLKGSAGQQVDWNLRFGTDREAAGTPVFTSDRADTDVTGGVQVTTFSGTGTIPQGSHVWLTTSAIAGVVTEFFLSIDMDGLG